MGEIVNRYYRRTEVGRGVDASQRSHEYACYGKDNER